MGDALEIISKEMEHWVVYHHNNPSSSSSSIVTTSDSIQNVLSTCRVLASTPRDYDGRSKSMLQYIVADGEYESSFPSSNDEHSNGLEYRSWRILERLANETKSNMLRHLGFNHDGNEDNDEE